MFSKDPPSAVWDQACLPGAGTQETMSQCLVMLVTGSLEGKPLLFQSQAHLPPGMTAAQKLRAPQGVRHRPWSATGSESGATRWRDERPWPEPRGAAPGLQRGELVGGGTRTEQGPQDLGQDLIWPESSRVLWVVARQPGGGSGRGLGGKARVSAGEVGQLIAAAGGQRGGCRRPLWGKNGMGERSDLSKKVVLCHSGLS